MGHNMPLPVRVFTSKNIIGPEQGTKYSIIMKHDEKSITSAKHHNLETSLPTQIKIRMATGPVEQHLNKYYSNTLETVSLSNDVNVFMSTLKRHCPVATHNTLMQLWQADFSCHNIMPRTPFLVLTEGPRGRSHTDLDGGIPLQPAGAYVLSHTLYLRPRPGVRTAVCGR